jgi:hypothetical protein
MRTTAFALFSPILLAACTEYTINKDGVTPNPGDDTGDPALCFTSDYDASTIALLEACQAEPELGTFTPVVKWNKGTWSVHPESSNIMMTPIVVSLTDDNGDGKIDDKDVPDILAITYSGGGSTPVVLRAVSGDTGAEIWSVAGNWQITGALAAGDIDGDGIVEIIVPQGSAVAALEHDGTQKWTSQQLNGHVVGTSDAPAIADMNGDGDPEIIMGRAILNSQGGLVGAGSLGKGHNTGNVGATSVVADMNLDGQQEVIVGNAMYRMDGSPLCSNNNLDGYPAVGNFDADPEGEFIVVSQGGEVRLHDTNCQPIWTASIPGASGYGYGGPPTIADYDGDLEPEIGVAANSSYTVFDTDGQVLWQKPTQDATSGNTGSAVFDFEGDGYAEAIYADETRLWVFNGISGEVKLESTDHASNTWTEYPVVADVDGDDHAEIIMTNNNTGGIPITGITVIEDVDDSWRPARKIWNQHAYSITNVNDDGTIPRIPDTNWATYNSFRSGDMTAALPGADYPDLIAVIDDVCTLFCDDGELTISARIGNQGFAPVFKDVEIVLYAETAAGDVEWARQMVSGGIDSGGLGESITFEVTGVDLSTVTDLRLEVDGGNSATDGGAYSECDETNNTGAWGKPICF